MRKARVLLLFVAVLAAGSVQAGDEMRPGKWEITQTMKMGGQSMPPQTITYCHTVKDEKQPAPGQTIPEGCKTGKMEHSGSTVRWSFSCTGDNAMEGTGEMTQHADSYEGVMHMKTQAGEMTTHMKGKRLGDC